MRLTMKTIILATNNKNKLKEFQSISSDITFCSLEQIGYTKEIIENGSTFSENALIKARQIALELNCIVISDDSGLEVDALNGAPGIYSARYAGTHRDEDNNRLLIQNLQGKENRRAQYVCAICVCHPDGNYRIVEGTCEGLIQDQPRGDNGFGYDPYFYIPQFGKTFAEVPLEVKNTISHRAKALRKMMEVCNEDFSFKR